MEDQNSIKQKKQYNLQADLITGWKPKLKIIGPMPLNFDNLPIDRSLNALLYQQSAFYSVVYLGPRPTSSFQMHQMLNHTYRYKYSHLLKADFPHLRPFFKKFYAQFEPQVRRKFYGMNPAIKDHQIIFNSCFQSGNLDAAVRIRAFEYDILLRVDSNTAGHVLWYNFKITNQSSSSKTITLNLANLRKNKSAYSRGMKPFICRSDGEWRQNEEPILTNEATLRYQKQNLELSLSQQFQQTNSYRKVSFNLCLSANQTVSVAYGIPYTYTQLIDDIKNLKQLAKLNQIRFDVDYSRQSLSGLQIPIIRIGQNNNNNNKYCVFIIARQHPGQSHSSYTVKGTIKQLLNKSDLSNWILQRCDFVIIPMINPDGVVMGNFRTSLYGKDLNRLFKSKQLLLAPEVIAVREVATQLMQIYKKKFMLFMDYHGHSTRKNAFLIGPGMLDAKMLNDIRVFPKIIAQNSDMFRYPSCSFRRDPNKATTARALVSRLAGLAYTLQISNWAYFKKDTNSIKNIDISSLIRLGEVISQSICIFLQQKITFRIKKLMKYEQKQQKKKKIENKIVSQRHKNIYQNSGSKARTITQISYTKQINNFDHQLRLSQIKQKIKQQASSDGFSEKGMDSDSQKEDMEQQKFKKYVKQASDMLVQFQQAYYGDSFKKGLSKYKINDKSLKILPKQKKKRINSIQPCFKQQKKRKTISPSSNRQKLSNRIGTLNKIQSNLNHLKNFQTPNKIILDQQSLKYAQQYISKQSRSLSIQKKNKSKQFLVNKDFEKLNTIRQDINTKSGIFKKNNIQLTNFQKQQYLPIRLSSIEQPRIKHFPTISSHKVLNDLKKPPKYIFNTNKGKQMINDILKTEKIVNKNNISNLLKLSQIDYQKRNQYS